MRAPEEIAICATATEEWDEHVLVLVADAGLPFHFLAWRARSRLARDKPGGEVRKDAGAAKIKCSSYVPIRRG